MITVTFIRHGESTDNLKPVWAGWADAPLSNHGMNQARALGEAFVSTSLTTIWTSPLQRAFATAQALYDAQPQPKPPFLISSLLKEQHFGAAEGKRYLLRQHPDKSLEDHFASGQYPVLFKRHQKFPDGESLDDLRARAEQAIDELVLPHVAQATQTDTQDVHLALVSHGLCISEMVAALLRKNQGRIPHGDYRGLMNTAWHRVVVQVMGQNSVEVREVSEEKPALVVEITAVNRHEHIDTLKRQKGGIGSSAHDPKQQDIRDFFGGGMTCRCS